MLHLSNISIAVDYIVYIRWVTNQDHMGNFIQPSIAVFLDHEKLDSIGEYLPTVLYFPEDSPNARLLKQWRDSQLSLREQVARRELDQN